LVIYLNFYPRTAVMIIFAIISYLAEGNWEFFVSSGNKE
jgi:hypothetical protein